MPRRAKTSRLRPETVLRRAESASAAARLIAARYGDSGLTLTEVADELHISPRQLQRCLFDQERQTFTDLLFRMRMKKAVEMMAAGVPIERIARSVGYRHTSNFCTAFRRHFGEPAGDARRAVRLYSKGGSRLRRKPPRDYRREYRWSKRQGHVHRIARDLARRGVLYDRRRKTRLR